MAKFNVKVVNEFKELAAKSMYIKKEWSTSDKDKMTLQEYVELVDPLLRHIGDNPTIIAKERKDGNIFLKMWIPLVGDTGIEMDLSYENDFEEGDEIDKNSLSFCIERFLEKSHLYATGTVI
jgi:hypothetical protein